MLSTLPTRLFSVGDSLSDSGVVFRLTDRLLRDPIVLPVPDSLLDGPGYAGVFSDGPVHTQLLDVAFGAPLTGYAVGGARVEGERLIGEQVSGGLPDGSAEFFFDPALSEAERAAILGYDMNVAAQVARLAAGQTPTPGDAGPGAGAGETTLVTFFAGLNDFADFAAEAVDNPIGAILEAPQFVARLADDAQDAIDDLAAAAVVDQLAVYTLPLLSFFPVPEDVDSTALSVLNGLIDVYNDELTNGAERAEDDTGKQAIMVRVDELAEEIDANPETYGFLDKGPYYLGGGTNPEYPEGASPEEILADPALSFPRNPEVDPELAPDELQFFDQLHFSSSMHERLAAFAEASLTKEALFLGDARDLALAMGDPHLILGEDGSDRILSGRADDTVLAGRGDDFVWAGLGDDVVSGGAGEDDLRGGAGADLLAGGAGDDIVRGGAGNDVLIGGPGDDLLHGGLGDDALIWVAPEVSGQAGGTGVYAGGAGHDLLWLIVDTGRVAALEEEIAGTGEGGTYELTSLGLRTTGIEEVVVWTADDPPADPAFITPVDFDAVATAYAWGFL